jgi:hypothetical protein
MGKPPATVTVALPLVHVAEQLSPLNASVQLLISRHMQSGATAPPSVLVSK